MRIFRGGAAGGSSEECLNLYQHAYLAGGGVRVAESAVVSLIERGTLALVAARLRVTGDEPPQDPVELAVIAACPRSKPVREVLEAVSRSPAVDDLARHLISLGLVHRRRRKPTRAGRRRLAAATGRVPAHVLHGPTAVAPGSTPRGLLGAHPVPDGLGRTLIRMGKALDDDRGHGADGGGGGGSFGGGGGGGGD